jgi:hypothetical protein
MSDTKSNILKDIFEEIYLYMEEEANSEEFCENAFYGEKGQPRLLNMNLWKALHAEALVRISELFEEMSE